MPGLDKTGPYGQGAMTGRRMGKCTGNSEKEFQNFGRGRGFRGRGGGFGRRNMGYGYSSYFDISEKTIIENEINSLNDQLESLRSRLNELEKDE